MVTKSAKFKQPPEQLSQASLLHKGVYFLASTFWTGHLPASGTWGALVAWVLHVTFFPDAFTLEQWPIGLSILLGVIIIGTICSEMIERLTGEKDDSRITIDEVAGYYLAVLFLPAGLQYTIPAFALARFFDIIKPPPAKQLQDFHGGIGIMIDDLIASVYACVIMNAIVYFLLG